MGPEAALGMLGGGLGGLFSRKRGMSREDQKTNTMTGMAAAFGGFLPAPFLSAMLLMELLDQKKEKRFQQMLILMNVSAIVSFCIYYSIEESTWLEHFDPRVPVYIIYEFEMWHLSAGLAIGMAGSFLATIHIIITGICKGR